MDGFSINKILFGIKNCPLYLKKKIADKTQETMIFNNEMNNGLQNTKPQNIIHQNLQSLQDIQTMHYMNAFGAGDRSTFIKNLLGLPQNLAEILMKAQNLNKPLYGGTLGMGNLNQDLLKNSNALSKMFEEINIENLNIAQNANIQATQAKSDIVALMFSGMISMPDISKLILQNSKQAVAAIIVSMASASRQNLEGKQLQETLSVINSCISMAESDNPAQNLKSLMMLYLPWLPLNEGVGFDLEIETQNGENESNDSKLTVLIQTKNYGNLKGVFTLTTTNSVDIYIICSESFPKGTLLRNMQNESSSHAMNTTIDIEAIAPKEEKENVTAETKVNLSATNEMNPYLLLMAHSFIRNTILIDNETIE
ncbi:MAG: hypothetical protein MJ237_07845 [bacterium]|nr:hypothetical protein [bacterium]